MNLNKTNNIILNLLYLLIFGFLIAIILFNSLHRYLDPDELEAIHSSWKLLQGEKIYVDFFQHHHPLLYYSLIPVIALLGENTFTIIAIRIIVFCLLLLIFVTTYYLGLKIFNKETGIISLVLLSTTIIFINKAIEIRPDVPQTLFGLISVLLLLIFFENKQIHNLILSSLCLSVSFLFLQKTLFLILLISIILLINLFNKRIAWRDVFVYYLVFILCLMPYFFYLIYNNYLSTYFVLNWTFNTKFLYHFSPTYFLKDSYRSNSFLWFFYILGLFFFLKPPNQKQLGFISLGLLISVVFVRVAFQQYFMTSIPLIAILSANAINSIFKEYKFMKFIVVVLSIVLPLNVIIFPVFHPSYYISNSEQIKKIDYVLTISQPNDFVYDGDNKFNVFRKDIDYFWFSLFPQGGLETYKTMADYKYDIYELIDKKKPKIISKILINNMNDTRISNHYIKSDKYKDLFIRKSLEDHS